MLKKPQETQPKEKNGGKRAVNTGKQRVTVIEWNPDSVAYSSFEEAINSSLVWLNEKGCVVLNVSIAQISPTQSRKLMACILYEAP